MRLVFFVHSLTSDWNNGNAHFLRGVTRELLKLGHEVTVHEPIDGWSRTNLLQDIGPKAVNSFQRCFLDILPCIEPYRPSEIDLERAVDRADIVIVHEWNDPELVNALGTLRNTCRNFRLLFHDTHHRMVLNPLEASRYDISAYDGVLAFGRIVKDLYLQKGWAREAWVWHEAADVDTFYPMKRSSAGDLVWIGNWGDDERSEELREFVLEPVRSLALRANIHGVRYPETGLGWIRTMGARYCGWIANHQVPERFAQHRVTVHVPRRPYAAALPGIPTIRVFEALACGIPLVCAPWEDAEGLFTPGRDYLLARDGTIMTRLIRDVLNDRALAESLAEQGLRTVRNRHTCRHRALELLDICTELNSVSSPTPQPAVLETN
ncbi:MAG: glycosyltransferase [Desulfovibrionales bacterium]